IDDAAGKRYRRLVDPGVLDSCFGEGDLDATNAKPQSPRDPCTQRFHRKAPPSDVTVGMHGVIEIVDVDGQEDGGMMKIALKAQGELPAAPCDEFVLLEHHGACTGVISAHAGCSIST